MRLSDKTCKNTKPTEKSKKLSDGHGLYLEVMPNGSKYWRLKYRFNGKEKRLAFGVYPEISLKQAREQRDQARKLLSSGTDPSENRKAKKASRQDRLANSFEVIAREWFAKQIHAWSPNHGERILRRLEKDIFPWMGRIPISEVKAPDLLLALRKIEERGALETAHRTLQNCGQVFRYAIVTGRAERDISSDLRGALSPVRKKHLSAITDPQDVGALLRAIDSYQGYFITKYALRLAPLVFVRPGELRQAEWSEIDLEKAEWNIPAEKMKMREAHLVPLSRQAVEILQDLYPQTHHCSYVFPSVRSNKRPMSNNSILAALRRMGYSKEEMTGHGFRAMARTLLDEILGVRPDFIEHQLAHSVRDPLGRAYNRTKHLAERKKMMQQWADYLDELKVNSNLLYLNAGA